MMNPISQKFLYEPQERELLNAIWFKCAVAEANAAARGPRVSRPWFVRLEEWVSRFVSEKPVVETHNLCCTA